MAARKEVFTAGRMVGVQKEVGTESERTAAERLNAHFDDIDAEINATGDIRVVGSADISDSDVGTGFGGYDIRPLSRSSDDCEHSESYDE